MTQAQLERAVCRATGESRERIRRMGFSLLNLSHHQPPMKPKTRSEPRHALTSSRP